MANIDKKIVLWEIVTGTEEPPKRIREIPEERDAKLLTIRHPASDAATYLTISIVDGKPLELFIESKDVSNKQWTSALARQVSAIWRHDPADYTFMLREMQEIHCPVTSHWHQGRQFPSLVARIGYEVEHGLKRWLQTNPGEPNPLQRPKNPGEPTLLKPVGATCPKCQSFSLIKEAGCEKCLDCGYSKCG